MLLYCPHHTNGTLCHSVNIQNKELLPSQNLQARNWRKEKEQADEDRGKASQKQPNSFFR